MHENSVIGIDLGGTNIRGATVFESDLSPVISKKINNNETIGEVLSDIFFIIDKLMTSSVNAIGIGVPGIVDLKEGIVYDVMNIPSWKENSVPLKKILEEKYDVPVAINNDANCFALGEYYFGIGKHSHSLVGVAVGTGLGAGIIISDKLYSGSNCVAGEFGMIDYLDHNVEYYASGQFFKNVYNLEGEKVFEDANKGDKSALKMYEELGTHLGNAIKTIMYTLDTDLIVLGGSVSLAYNFFEKSMWKQIQAFGFPRSVEHLKIVVSELRNSGILGAAALCYDVKKQLASL